MTKSLSLSKRTIAVGLALTVALWLAGTALVVPAQAVTIDELLDQIAALQAQVLALQGGGGGACFAFTRDLYNGVGSGDDVVALQDYLTGTGHFTFSGGSTGFFGPITQSAVSAWQADNGVSPTAGYWGPLSQAQYNSICTPGDGGDGGGGDVGDLQGEEGSYKNFEVLGDPSSETVYESDDQRVIGWKWEAQDSDLRTERVRIRFDATATSDDKPWKWLEEICLDHGTDEVVCKDADTKADWSEAVTNIYEKTFAGLKEITREGDESEFFVRVKTKSTIDSSMDGDVVTVTLQTNAVRAEDAAGEDVTGHSSVLTETFTFDTDPQGKLELSINSDDNDARVVEADATNDTTDVVLLTFKTEAKDGPVLITDLAVDINSANSATGDVGDQLANVDLYREGSKVKTESIASTAADVTVTFDNIDQTQEIGTEEWMIKGKVKNIDGVSGGFAEADGVVLDIDNADVTSEAVNGDSITATGGTVTGGNVVFYSTGIQLAFVSVSAEDSPALTAQSVDEEGTFEIVFDVTAFGADIYIPDVSSTTAAAAGTAVGSDIDLATGTIGASTVSTDIKSDGTDSGNGLLVSKDNTQRFTVSTTVTATTGTADNVFVSLAGLGWATSNTTTAGGLYSFNLSAYNAGPAHLTPQ